MDINQIKCFISVARTLNFSEAARQNYVSQSTVSRYVSELEKEFQVKLFARSHRDVVLTDEGKILLPYAVEIVETLQKAKSVIRKMHSGGMGKISITFDAVSGGFAETCLKKFSRAYPNISVEMTELNGQEDSQTLADTAFDFHFMLRDMLPDSENMESVLTHTDNLVLVVPKGCIPAGSKCELKDMQNEKFVLLSENVNPILYMEILDLFRTFHIPLGAVTCYDSVKSLFIASGAGLGISILPLKFAQMHSCRQVDLIPIDGVDTRITYIMAYRRENSNPAAALFEEIVRKTAEKQENSEEEYAL